MFFNLLHFFLIITPLKYESYENQRLKEIFDMFYMEFGMYIWTHLNAVLQVF